MTEARAREDASLSEPEGLIRRRPADPATRSFPVHEYRYASATTRVDSPSWLVLLAKGWTIEHVDERYWSVLMRSPCL